MTEKLKSGRFRLTALLLAALAVEAVALAAFAAETITVSQHGRKFAPDVLHLAPGTIVHIVNDDRVTHHVYVDAPNMKFDSGEQPVGTTVDLTFDRAGTFQVLCAIHPTMHLQVTVE